METKILLNCIHHDICEEYLSALSASICGRTSTCKLAAGLSPARYDARVARQENLPEDGKFLRSRNTIALQTHLKAEEAVINEDEELYLDRMLLADQEEGKAWPHCFYNR